MEKQQDFLSELTLLQYHAAKLGVLIDRTPKCHPEIAGEGIEYVWGVAKMTYRLLPIANKQKKEGFKQAVHSCFSPDKLSISTVRKCGKRAREYILAYKAFADLNNDNDDDNDDDNTAKTSISHQLIEKAVKSYRVHRSVMDTDTKFLNTLKEMDSDQQSLLKDVINTMLINILEIIGSINHRALYSLVMPFIQDHR